MQGSDVQLLTAITTSGAVRTASIDIAIATEHTNQLIDITESATGLVADAGIETGFALISTPHTTCAVIVNEAEDGFTRDLARALEALAPEDATYEHNDAPHAEEWEAPNGHSHIRSAFLSSPSVMLPVRDGRLALGRWQRIFLVELDRARPRSVQITLLGASS